MLKQKNTKVKFIKKFIKKKKNYFLFKKVVKISRIWISCYFKPGLKKRYKKVRKKYFVWKRKQKRKSVRHKQNFFFFFTKKRKRWPRIALRWLKFQLKVLKKGPLEVLNSIENKIVMDFKKRYPLKLKHKVLKKRALKIKLKSHYKIPEKHWSSLARVLKKKKNKVIYLYFFLEFRASTACLRLHFFWHLKRAHFWVLNGAIAINSLSINSVSYQVKINDFIQVLGPKALWEKKIMRIGGLYFHTKFNYSFNYSELSCKYRSGILLKVPTQTNEFRTLYWRRRKSWIKLKTFLYLANSFY